MFIKSFSSSIPRRVLTSSSVIASNVLSSFPTVMRNCQESTLLGSMTLEHGRRTKDGVSFRITDEDVSESALHV